MEKGGGISEVLQIAVHAPSGDNSQPWYFRIEGQTLQIFNVPTADTTLYNFRQRGSYFAHGALIENISIVAKEFGLSAKITLFPEHNCTASIEFSPVPREHLDLFSMIQVRGTNRKPYEEKNLESAHKDALLRAVDSTRASLRFVESDEGRRALARSISINEEILMENRYMHDTLFRMIRWSRADERRAPGLYIKTMEFPLPVQIMFRLLIRFWAVVRILNRVGFSKSVPRQSMPIYRASSAIAAIVIKDTSDEAYLDAGRSFQRVWLTATLLGLSVQPTTAIPYLMQRVEENSAESLSPKHIKEIKDAYAPIEREFALKPHERIAMLFRIGYDGVPTARSSKMPPKIVQ